MAESFLDRIAKAKGLTRAQALTEIVKPDPKIASAGPGPAQPDAKPITTEGWGKQISDVLNIKTGMMPDGPAKPNATGANVYGKDVTTLSWPAQTDKFQQAWSKVVPGPAPGVLPSLTTLNKVTPAAPGSDGVVDAVSAPDPMPNTQPPAPVMPAQPKPAPPVQPIVQAAPAPVEITPVPAAPVEVGPVVPQITMEDKPKGIDWNKVGEIAKRTGGSILDVLQAAVAGRTAGLLGKTFNPATDTPAGIKAGKEQDAAAQKDAMTIQFGFAKQLKEMDQDFQQRQAQINQAYEDKRIAAEHDYQSTRDAEAYKRAMAQAQADRAAAMEQLNFARGTALQVERTRQGLPVTGGPGVAGSDPAGLGQFLPKAAPK